MVILLSQFFTLGYNDVILSVHLFVEKKKSTQFSIEQINFNLPSSLTLITRNVWAILGSVILVCRNFDFSYTFLQYFDTFIQHFDSDKFNCVSAFLGLLETFFLFPIPVLWIISGGSIKTTICELLILFTIL